MATILLPFERGALVRWESQGRGVRKSHVGVVVLVVPPSTSLGVGILANFRRRYNVRPIRPDATMRSERSYLVALLENGKRGKAPLYWPRVRHLKPYQAAVTEPAQGALDAPVAP